MSNSTITTTPPTTSSTFSPITSSTETSTTPTDTTTSSDFTSTTFSSSSFDPTSTSRATSSLVTFTSRVTVSASGTNTPSIVTVTSTASGNQPTPDSAASASRSSAAAASSSAAALATGGNKSSNSSGLSDGGRIAIAVVVPIVAIAAFVAAAIFFWKKRKARKTAEEERRKEVEEYGYNPNNDPTLPAVGSTYGETNSEMAEDNSGYRGWGATSTQRKPSTTLGSSSNRPAIGMAVSDTTSNGGQYNGSHPSEGNTSVDPLMNGGQGHDDSETVGALGGAPVVSGQNRDLNRGPSNASSAYTGHRSDGSGDADRPVNGSYAPQHYYEDVGYYNDAQPNHGPYGDGSYGGSQGQPIIRDVQARRNTRIEKPSVLPQQGNAGIAQNF